MEIDELIGVWPSILSQKKRGALRKLDVVEALRSGEPIPPIIADQVADLLADIISGKHKFKAGKKPKDELVKVCIALTFEYLEKELEAGDLDGIYDPEEQQAVKQNLAAGVTPYTMALDVTAERFDISTRQIESYLSDYRNNKK